MGNTQYLSYLSEFRPFLALSISETNESRTLCKYEIFMENQERYWKVSFDCASISITCSYRKLEPVGILYSHALKVLEENNIKSILHEYILRRWTRQSHYGTMQYSRGKEDGVDPKLSRTQMFRHVICKFIKVIGPIDLIHTEIIKLQSQDNGNDNHSRDNPIFPSYIVF